MIILYHIYNHYQCWHYVCVLACSLLHNITQINPVEQKASAVRLQVVNLVNCKTLLTIYHSIGKLYENTLYYYIYCFSACILNNATCFKLGS